jgi:hypothetical protein
MDQVPLALTVSNWISLFHHSGVLFLFLSHFQIYTERIFDPTHYLDVTLSTKYDSLYLQYAWYHFVIDIGLNASLQNAAGYLIVVHHFCVLFLYDFVSTNNEYMFAVYIVHVCEMSSFLNVFSEIVKTYYGENVVYGLTKMLFAVSFVLIRSYFMVYVWMFYISVNGWSFFHPCLSMGLLGLLGLHIHWYRLLFSKINKMLTKTD